MRRAAWWRRACPWRASGRWTGRRRRPKWPQAAQARRVAPNRVNLTGQNGIAGLSGSGDGLSALRQHKKIFIFYKDLERLK
ncbi:hypothetical protein EMIT0158MI4_60309 [Burkholderia ambifaria]